MEASSPLAAMQPPSYMAHHSFVRDFMPMGAPRTFASGDFNFRDLSMRMAMRKSQHDYFSQRGVQSSSPTTELVADLSQNFTIDQSPVIPTPRRALFSHNVFSNQSTGNVTTPPVPSSSPGTLDVDMDLSPLPHKPAHFFLALQSPTPDVTPNESTACLLSPPTSDCRPDSAPPLLQHERKKPPPLRPSLGRAKALSSSLIEQQRPALPAFRFGGFADPKPTNTSSLSLEQIFEESSPLRQSSSPVAPCQQPRARVLYDSSNFRNGSPLSSHMRKVSNQCNPIRPRKQFRRAQSMYQTADDVMKQDALPQMSSVMTCKPAHVLKLPLVAKDDQPNDLPRISKETMIDVLDGKYDHWYKQRVVIDCRFEYEYKGGHIKGAQNYNDKETLAAQLFEVEPTLQSGDGCYTKPSLVIFHYRMLNADSYPALTYPEMYILDGGYSSFFRDHRARCDPQDYVEMDAKDHVAACERGMGKVKHAQRAKLMRAQTFAFGQHGPQLDSSPTAAGRCRVDDDLDTDMCLNYTPARPDYRKSNQRMFSFPGA